MVVNEGLEAAQPEQMLPEPGSTALPEPGTIAAEGTPAPPQNVPRAIDPSWLRLAYSFEFLIALLATFTLWIEIGGQGHLDLMPWYTKLVCGVAMSWCSIRFTAGLVEERRAWNARSVRWLVGLVVIATVMAGITFYYHLQEAPEQPDTDDNTATSVKVSGPPSGFSRTSDRISR
jgi:hypothetical protein